MLESASRILHHGVSKMAERVVVLQDRVGSHLGYTSLVISQSQTRVAHVLILKLPSIGRLVAGASIPAVTFITQASLLLVNSHIC